MKFIDTVTHVPADWANAVDELVFNVFNQASDIIQVRKILGYGTLAMQNSNAVNISGGTIYVDTLGTTAKPIKSIVATSMSVIDVAYNPTDVVNLQTLTDKFTSWSILGNEALVDSLGTLAYQNANNVGIVGGTLDAVDIGMINPGAGKFVTLQATNTPVDATDVVTYGFLINYFNAHTSIGTLSHQNADSVSIKGGYIDGTVIGVSNPASGTFTKVTLLDLPTSDTDAVNRRFVESALSIVTDSIKSMSLQESEAIDITGGSIDGTVIGAHVPKSAVFTTATINSGNGILTINANNESGYSQVALQVAGKPVIKLTATHDGGSITLAQPTTITGSLKLDKVEITSGKFAQTIGDNVLIGVGAPVANTSVSVYNGAYIDTLNVDFCKQSLGSTIRMQAFNKASGSVNLDTNSFGAFYVEINGSVAINLGMVNPNLKNTLYKTQIVLKRLISGNVTWNSNVYWKSALTVGIDAQALVDMYTWDGGLTWHCVQVM